MDGWSGAEARTWLAMDLLAPVHQLWAALEAAPAAQVTAEELLGEHRPVLTEAALAGGVDLERALVVGAALARVGGFADGDLVAAVECALVDEACRLPLLPLVNVAADLLVELERDVGQNDAAHNETGHNETGHNETGQNDAGDHEAAGCDPDGSLGLVGPDAPGAVGAPVPAASVPAEPVPVEAAAAVRSEERVGVRVVVRVASGCRAYRRDRGGGPGPARESVVPAAAPRAGRRSRAPPPGRAVT